ncbi:13E12 repeat family protein, partial [Mycobacterium sp. MBM]|nr:13E12 repeat family protein [Mycobacterium sp. MBM]
MDATHLNTFIDALIDDLTPAPVPENGGRRRLCHLLDAPRRVVDDAALLAVLGAAVTLGNLADHVIAQAVAAAERAGIPARKHLRTGADLLTLLGVAPGAAYRAARVGRAAPTLPALTQQQRLGGVGIEFADAVGKGVGHIEARVPLSDEERAAVVRSLMIQTTPAGVGKKARGIALAKAAESSAEDDGTVPVAEDSDLNDMSVVQTEDGRVAATLDLDALTGEELWAALDPLCRPVPLPDGSPDPRPAGRRRAEAFGQIMRTYLSGSGRPTSGGVLPHVTLIRPATVGVDCLGFTGPVSAATADLIACDSTLTSVIVDHS